MTLRSTDAMRSFTEHKAARGLKSSSKRAFIVDFFMKAHRHFTVEELYNEIKSRKPGISYTTVYRTLKLLTECGIACESVFDDSVSRYEPLGRSAHHDHLICRTCGRIIEFENPRIERLQNEVARRYRFRVAAHRLEIYGDCSECQKKTKE